MPLQLVIPAMPRTAGAAPESLPRLPALCELLRLSDAMDPDSNWRSGLLRDLGGVKAIVPEAVIAASVLDVSPGRGVCLVAPVHAVAGLHRVHLHAAGILPLPANERAELADGFATQFAPDARLRDAGGQWLLEAGCASAAQETDPAEWAGAPLERQPAGSPEQRLLRRLGAEIEMWLADLPVNARRRSRGHLPVNLFWMWGGGVTGEPGQLPALAPARVHGSADDAWLAGCAGLAGGRVLPLPGAWPGFHDTPDRLTRDVLVLPAPADAGQLLWLETHWLLPALDDLRAGRIASLELRLGRQLHQVRRGRLRRLLRRSKPWWQAATA